MLHSVWKGGSLRAWIGVGMTLAIVPLAVSAVAGYLLLHHGVTMAFHDIDLRQHDQIETAEHLRVLILEAGEPLDSFIAEGLAHQPPAYRSLQRRITVGFDALEQYLDADTSLGTIVSRAKAPWLAADAAAMEALTHPRRAGDRHADTLLDRFHVNADSAVAILGMADDSLATDLREEILRYVGHSRRLTLLAGLVSLLAIVAGIFVIGRVMSSSVERLVSGAARFASGDRDHRIDIQVPPELHRVAEEFNRMIGRIHESEDALAELARRDALTRLLNRRAFDEELQEIFTHWRRRNEPFALLAFDLDHFKQINDRYGHAGGDDVLRAAAQRMEAELRPLDHLFRTGGEEFAALLVDSDPASAQVVAERLRRAVEASAIPVGNHPVEVTVSVGVAVITPDIEPAALVEAADGALYRAKVAGRNRVVMA